MLVIDEETGLTPGPHHLNDAPQLMFKTRSDYWAFLMEGFRDEYYGVPAYRHAADKLLEALDD